MTVRIPALVWRRTISIVTIVLFVLLSLFFAPMCACPWYHAELSLMGLVPLLVGPRLFRWLGCGVIVLGLMHAWADYKEQIWIKQETMRIRSEAARQTPGQ